MAKKSRFSPIVVLGTLLAAAIVPSGAYADGSGPFEVAQTIHVGGKGNWDYVAIDSRRKLLFIPRTTHTQVLDVASGKLVADIPGQSGNHGVVINHRTERGFISDGPGFVVIFDLKNQRGARKSEGRLGC